MPDALLAALAQQQPPASPQQLMLRARALAPPASDSGEALRLLQAHTHQVWSICLFR
jgi:hypothetical protein